MAASWTKTTERAELKINGMIFRDWETVLVIHSCQEAGAPYYRFRFTCSEGMPLAKNWAGLQIKPGMHCEITLAGIPAFTGLVQSRQVYYDAMRHYIEIQGASNLIMSTASVIHKTMEFRNKTFEEIAREVLKPLGIKLKVEGGQLPKTKFEVERATPGVTVHDFLDHLARGLKVDSSIGISFTGNADGDFVVLVGPTGGRDEVVEGKNILIGREIIFNPMMTGTLPGVGQSPGTDQKHGSKVAQIFAEKETPGASRDVGKDAPPSVIVHETNATKTLLEGRLSNEGSWLGNDEITVFATVHGWLRPSGGLWDRGQHVSVMSPMLVMYGEDLILKVATFTQDNASGTRTTLELVNANAMGKGIPQTK